MLDLAEEVASLAPPHVGPGDFVGAVDWWRDVTESVRVADVWGRRSRPVDRPCSFDTGEDPAVGGVTRYDPDTELVNCLRRGSVLQYQPDGERPAPFWIEVELMPEMRVPVTQRRDDLLNRGET